MLRKWQELPDDMFQVYHIEAGVARLLSLVPSSSKEQQQLVSKFKMDVPPNETADMTENILGWIELYLRSGVLLSAGIMDAYKSPAVTTGSMKAGLTAAK